MSTSNTIVPASLFLANLESLKGICYLWGGKNAHGLDCSGAVTFAYKQSGGEDLTAMWNCAKLITECKKVAPIDYVPGLLSFYGVAHEIPNHVMTTYTSPANGVLTVFGACGGNHYTTTKELALKLNACVKERPSIVYRHDFLGCFSWDRLDYTK